MCSTSRSDHEAIRVVVGNLTVLIRDVIAPITVYTQKQHAACIIVNAPFTL